MGFCFEVLVCSTRSSQVDHLAKWKSVIVKRPQSHDSFLSLWIAAVVIATALPTSASATTTRRTSRFQA
jgi:hypothetical protein